MVMQLISAEAADRSIFGLSPKPPAAILALGNISGIRRARAAICRKVSQHCQRRADHYGAQRDAAPLASMHRCYLLAMQDGYAAQAAGYEALAEDRDADAKDAFALADECFTRASDMRALGCA